MKVEIEEDNLRRESDQWGAGEVLGSEYVWKSHNDFPFCI